VDPWQWINLAIFVGLALSVGAGLLILSALVGPKRPLPEKLDPYECGVPQLDSSRHRFSVKFYLVAIMFMLFDIEVVFLLPWAVVYQKLSIPAAVILIEMLVFVAILVFGLLYVVRRGVVDWR
jgi:NADH-quinone oxidoreductase subunit A